MKKLLSVLIAGAFAIASSNGFAQEKKADAPTADAKKMDSKADKPAKKPKRPRKQKKPSPNATPLNRVSSNARFRQKAGLGPVRLFCWLAFHRFAWRLKSSRLTRPICDAHPLPPQSAVLQSTHSLLSAALGVSYRLHPTPCSVSLLLCCSSAPPLRRLPKTRSRHCPQFNCKAASI